MILDRLAGFLKLYPEAELRPAIGDGGDPSTAPPTQRDQNRSIPEYATEAADPALLGVGGDELWVASPGGTQSDPNEPVSVWVIVLLVVPHGESTVTDLRAAMNAVLAHTASA